MNTPLGTEPSLPTQESFPGLRNNISILLRRILVPSGSNTDKTFRKFRDNYGIESGVNTILVNIASVFGYNTRAFSLYRLGSEQTDMLSMGLQEILQKYPAEDPESLENDIFASAADVLADLYYPSSHQLKIHQLREMASESLNDFRAQIAKNNPQSFEERSKEALEQSRLESQLFLALKPGVSVESFRMYLDSHLRMVESDWSGSHADLPEDLKNRLSRATEADITPHTSLGRLTSMLFNATRMNTEQREVVVEYILGRLNKYLGEQGFLRAPINPELQLEKLSEIFGLEDLEAEDIISDYLMDMDAGDNVGTAAESALRKRYTVESVDELQRKTILVLGEFRNALTEEGHIVAYPIRSAGPIMRLAASLATSNLTKMRPDISEKVAQQLVHKTILSCAMEYYIARALSDLEMDGEDEMAQDIIDLIIERGSNPTQEQ
jgi:hypothetical protein